jgi:N-acetylmuramic acid 6-phosphate (MurNAc-6-P) etherase
MPQILELLDLKPSQQSVDYVENKKQFHLFSLLTEQRHPKTWNLSSTIQSDTEAGLSMLLSVDQDVTRRLGELARDPAMLQQAVEAVVEAARTGRKIYVYGCGATGRLAKQMESSFWRPFWTRVKRHDCWKVLKDHLPADLEEHLIGEMTGADRALVSSLEGFEDLQLIGRLQLADRGISRGDVVFCVTEGGETSSVIGTILGALDQYGPLNPALIEEARRRLYFVYNNPDEVLRPFTRSAAVLDNPAITRINLATGPQAITGSTRLQATTSETFVMGAILEEALARLLRKFVTEEVMRDLGFCRAAGIVARLADFEGVKAAVDSVLPSLAWFTDMETRTYRNGRFATYLAKEALITVFIDNTERSPTFRLYPLDRVQDPERKCWLQVWTEADDLKEAWKKFLGRPFRGLESSFYRATFEEKVEDPYLREAALRSLANAGNDQELLYDFSFSASNVERRGPQAGDLGVAVLVDDEFRELNEPGSVFQRFVQLHHERGASVALVLVTGRNLADAAAEATRALGPDDTLVHMALDADEDPLGLRRQIALKMLLNAHSTGIMAALGRVVGNTMTNVSPSNLKLVGRATFLIQSHVNDVIAQLGAGQPLSFAEVNAVLFEAIDYVREQEMGQTAEVAMSIIRILEALRRKERVSWGQARSILDAEGLASYLQRRTRRP